MNPKYKRMLEGMARNEKADSKRRLKRDWSTYILRCQDGSLYTGVTNDIERRLKMHNNGTGARYTRVRRPVELVYQENRMTRSEALIRECAIKAMPKAKKEELAGGKVSRSKGQKVKKRGRALGLRLTKSRSGFKLQVVVQQVSPPDPLPRFFCTPY